MSDVKRGHCWYCRKPGDKVPCPRCKIGVYCSQNCLGRDRRRHGSECQSFGPQKCSYCHKQLQNRLECSSCGEAYYCDRTCQKQDWKRHKHACKEVQLLILDAGHVWGKIREESESGQVADKGGVYVLPDLPFYFGNTLAADFLNLRQNEWESPHQADDPCLDKDYSVLSVGCGDIRSLVNTFAQLPSEFHGKLCVTMCDYDPFVMARNVLFLYMMVKYSSKPDLGKTLASVWYSVLLPEDDFNLLHEALMDLCTSKASLVDIMEGLVEMKAEEVEVLKQVWTVWCGMGCRCDSPDSIHLSKQRMKQRGHMLSNFSKIIPAQHRVSYRKWEIDGVVASSDVHRKDLPYYNPTLTGRKGWDATMEQQDQGYKGGYQPRDMEFVYCIQADAEPFHVWDFVEIEQYCDKTTSLPVMFHTYVSHVIQLAVAVMQEKRVTIQMTTRACQDLGHDSKFDRIFTSNLADYLGVFKLVTMFGPLLNPSNQHSVLVMDTLCTMEYWKFVVDETEFMMKEMNWRHLAYTDEEECGRHYIPHPWDYSFDCKWYIRHLKSLYLGGGYCKAPKVPSSRAVLEFGGLRMRDVRRELNTVVPYFYPKGPRQGGSVSGRLRVLEWIQTKSGIAANKQSNEHIKAYTKER